MDGLLGDKRRHKSLKPNQPLESTFLRSRGESAQTLSLGGRISFQAVCPERNMFRFYAIDIDRDLFGDVVICTHYGRIGTYGVLRKYWPKDSKEMKRIVQGLIRKRLNSEKRCGCQYKQVG